MFLGLGGVQIHCLFDFISFALILVMFNINVTMFFFMMKSLTIETVCLNSFYMR